MRLKHLHLFIFSTLCLASVSYAQVPRSIYESSDIYYGDSTYRFNESSVWNDSYSYSFIWYGQVNDLELICTYGMDYSVTSSGWYLIPKNQRFLSDPELEGVTSLGGSINTLPDGITSNYTPSSSGLTNIPVNVFGVSVPVPLSLDNPVYYSVTGFALSLVFWWFGTCFSSVWRGFKAGAGMND